MTVDSPVDLNTPCSVSILFTGWTLKNSMEKLKKTQCGHESAGVKESKIERMSKTKFFPQLSRYNFKIFIVSASQGKDDKQ